MKSSATILTPKGKAQQDAPITPSQRISLSLSDLQRSADRSALSATSASFQPPLRSTMPDHSQAVPTPLQGKSTADYKKELGKLLAKSRGTPYEYMLRRFVENKLRDMGVEDEQQNERLAHFRSPERPPLTSLSTSRFDSPNRPSPLYMSQLSLPPTPSSTAGSAQPQMRGRSLSSERRSNTLGDHGMSSPSPSRIDAMAVPLDRNRYKGPEISRVSTNHLGRQRPAPRSFTSSSPSAFAESEHMGEALTPSAAQPSPSLKRYTRSPTRSLTQSLSLISSHRMASAPLPVAPIVIPAAEFDEWYEQNQQWRTLSQDRIREEKQRRSESFAAQAQPFVYRASVKLAELAKKREIAHWQETAHQWQSQEPPNGGVHQPSTSDDVNQPQEQEHRRGRSRHQSSSPSLLLSSSATQCAQQLSSMQARSSSVDVYERLAMRGRVVAENHRQAHIARSQSEDRIKRSPSVDRSSFVPHLPNRSLQFAEHRRSRERTASSASVGASTASVVTAPVTVTARISKGTHGEAQQSHRSQLSTQQMAQQDIDRAKQLLAQKQEKEKKRLLREEYVDDQTVIKPFQPTIVAKESHRIMSKKNTSFEERNMRSVEATYARKVLGSRTNSPGPGHYSSLTMKNWTEVQSSPVRTSVSASHRASVEKRMPSPGTRGYSFGKAKLDKCITVEDLNVSSYAFQFSAPASPSHSQVHLAGSNSNNPYLNQSHGARSSSPMTTTQTSASHTPRRSNSMNSRYSHMSQQSSGTHHQQQHSREIDLLL